MNSNRREGSTNVKEFRFIRLVRDLPLMRTFYEEVFDWPVVEQWDQGVMYDTGAGIFELIQDSKAEKPSLSTRVAISVPDVRSLFESIKDKVTIEFSIRDNAWGDTSFRITDPDGFPITFFTPTK